MHRLVAGLLGHRTLSVSFVSVLTFASSSFLASLISSTSVATVFPIERALKKSAQLHNSVISLVIAAEEKVVILFMLGENFF